MSCDPHSGVQRFFYNVRQSKPILFQMKCKKAYVPGAITVFAARVLCWKCCCLRYCLRCYWHHAALRFSTTVLHIRSEIRAYRSRNVSRSEASRKQSQSRARPLARENQLRCMGIPTQDLVSRISLSDKILQMARGGASDNGSCNQFNCLVHNYNRRMRQSD